MTLCYSKIFMLAHFTIAIQDHIIPQTKKDDDIQAVIVNEEAAKPFFSWPFGASDSSKNKERETTLQLATATKAEPLTQMVRSRIQGHALPVVANSY